jgi:rRNA maturation protein Rpf1
MSRLYIQDNVITALSIKNNEKIYIIDENKNNPTKLVFTRVNPTTKKLEGEYFSTKIKEVVVFRRKKVLGIKLFESLIGYNYHVFCVPKKLVTEKLVQIYDKKEGVLVAYVR